MSTATKEITDLVISRNYRSEALQPGGTVMFAYLSFNEGIGPDRSSGTVAGHVNLKQAGVHDSDVGDFIVKGTFAVIALSDVTPPQNLVSIYFNSVTTLIGEQTLRGHMVLDKNWKTGRTTFSYTAKGGHPLITVSNAKVNWIPFTS
jgi:Domain of unknown function (DUF1842)